MEYKTIKIVRGDTKTLELDIKQNDIAVTDLDSVIMTVKNDNYTEEYIFQKKIGDGIEIIDNKYQIFITEDDTKSLDYGRYTYDIEITKGNIVYTAYEGNFIVQEETTFYNNRGE